jgi:ATP-dependent Clp protease ATP-binding subunit ClpX
MFELPSRKDVSKCVITKETISKGLKPTLVTSADGIGIADEPPPALAEESA